jgi:hypothetical protein
VTTSQAFRDLTAKLLRFQTREGAIRNVQKYFAQFEDGTSWSEELIRERSAEAGKIPQIAARVDLIR